MHRIPRLAQGAILIATSYVNNEGSDWLSCSNKCEICSRIWFTTYALSTNCIQKIWALRSPAASTILRQPQHGNTSEHTGTRRGVGNSKPSARSRPFSTCEKALKAYEKPHGTKTPFVSPPRPPVRVENSISVNTKHYNLNQVFHTPKVRFDPISGLETVTYNTYQLFTL